MGWWYICWRCLPQALDWHDARKERVSVSHSVRPKWHIFAKCAKCRRFRRRLYELYREK